MKFRFQNFFLTLALFTVAALASPQPAPSQSPPPPPPPSSCTGSTLCCNSVGSPNNALVSLLLGLLGVVVNDPTILIGVTCSPLSIIAGSAGTCSVQPVCCTNNSFNGVIALGCTPFNL